MTLIPWRFESTTPARASSRDIAKDYRERLALEEEERTFERQRNLAAQQADHNSPEVRIRFWEKVHGLTLPTSSVHPILEVVALHTRLELADVQAEQRARALRHLK